MKTDYRLQTTDVGHQKSDVGHQTSDFRKYRKSRHRALLWSAVCGLKSDKRGFTLIELMIVLVIIGMLAAMVVPRLSGRTKQAKIARTTADIAAIELALDLYELDLGKYPDTLDELAQRDVPSGLSVTSDQWNGPYLKKGLPKDPWGRLYVYTPDSQHNLDYDISSLGQDGQPGNDDITNWE